jgi:hypothetical protein
MTHACERLKLDRSGDDDESLMKKLFFSALVFVLSFVHALPSTCLQFIGGDFRRMDRNDMAGTPKPWKPCCGQCPRAREITLRPMVVRERSAL